MQGFITEYHSFLTECPAPGHFVFDKLCAFTINEVDGKRVIVSISMKMKSLMLGQSITTKSWLESQTMFSTTATSSDHFANS
jgi:hypothetical protein